MQLDLRQQLFCSFQKKMDVTRPEATCNWVTLVSCTLVVMFCAVGDILLERPVVRSHLWLRAIGDSLTHGIVGAFSWTAVVMATESLRSASKWIEILLAGILASSIDVDHFVAAKSMNLKVNTLFPVNEKSRFLVIHE